jgi:hypothetical protein
MSEVQHDGNKMQPGGNKQMSKADAWWNVQAYACLPCL